MTKNLTISNAMSICFKNGVKAYVICLNKNTFYIESIVSGKVKRYSKSSKNNKEANEALKKTYIFLAKKILGI